MASSSHREAGSVEEPRRGTGYGDQEQQGQDQRHSSRNSGVDEQPGTARSYKELLEVVKDLNKSCDAMSAQICTLNLKFSDLVTKSSILIDPDLTKVIHGDEENFPELISMSQQKDKMPKEQLNKKYEEVCSGLAQRLQQQVENNSVSTEMEEGGNATTLLA